MYANFQSLWRFFLSQCCPGERKVKLVSVRDSAELYQLGQRAESHVFFTNTITNPIANS